MNRPVNVAFCENGRGFGGAAISLLTYLNGRSDWVKPLIITGRSDDEYTSFSECGIWKVVRMRPKLEFFAKKYLGPKIGSIVDYLVNQIPAALHFAYIFRRNKVDLVYLNNDFYCNFAAILGAFLANKPVILHLRGFSKSSFSSRWVANHLQHFIYISEIIKQNGLDLGLSESNMTYVPEGIDVDKFSSGDAALFRRELELDSDVPLVTLVGGLVGWKGQEILIEAAPVILKSFPNVRFLLVGSAYGYFSDIENKLRTQIKNLGLQEAVLFLGGRGDIPNILAASDIVIHASTTPEPFGRTVIEGMAANCAVIAANEGGPLDVISHGVDGFLITPRDCVLLADKVLDLLKSKALRRQIGNNAQLTAKKYSIKNHVSKVEDAIIRALNI